MAKQSSFLDFMAKQRHVGQEETPAAILPLVLNVTASASLECLLLLHPSPHSHVSLHVFWGENYWQQKKVTYDGVYML